MAKVLLKKSSVGDNVPGTGDLDYGEVAINYADGRLYYKNSSNVIKSFVDSDLIDSRIGTTIQAHDANLTSFVNAFTLPTSDGSTNQVLATNGSGTLVFGNASVDSAELLNISTSVSLQMLDSSGSPTKTYYHSGGVTLSIYDNNDSELKNIYGSPADELEILDSAGVLVSKLWGGFPGKGSQDVLQTAEANALALAIALG